MGEVVSITYFTAPWCGPCKVFGPTLLAFAGREGIVVEKIDIDNNLDRAKEFDVLSVPTTIWHRDGKPIAHIVGARNDAALQGILKMVKESE
jgi:thioredoxin